MPAKQAYFFNVFQSNKGVRRREVRVKHEVARSVSHAQSGAKCVSRAREVAHTYARP